MKLLNTTTLQLEDFIDDRYYPPYAILSHTWGVEEILYEDITNHIDDWCHKKGASKVLECCKIAKSERYGYDWIWIDTCCIDKKSSTELSEAINSMYKWYARSEVCITYLADVRKDEDPLSRSRWFERGWTLQELIAPEYLDFWDQNWSFISHRSEIAGEIAEITHIDCSILGSRSYDQDLPLKYSIAQVMFWASGRRTTREEDIAYSLLGLFKVNMPLLYGEGAEQAFFRLQIAIVEKSDDQSILAWEGNCQDTGDRDALARSPESFRNCGIVQPTYESENVSKAEKPTSRPSITITQGGIALNLIICPCRQLPDTINRTTKMSFFFGVLDCGLEGYHQLARPALLLKRVSTSEEFVRADEQLYVLSPESSPSVSTLRQHEWSLQQYEACIDDWQFRTASLPARLKPATCGLETRPLRLDVGDILDLDLEKCSVVRHYHVHYDMPDREHPVPGGVVSLRKAGYERAFVLWEPSGFFGKLMPAVLSEDRLRKVAFGDCIQDMLIDKDLGDDDLIKLDKSIESLAAYDYVSATTIRSETERRKITVTTITRKFLGGSAPELKIEVTPLTLDAQTFETSCLPDFVTDPARRHRILLETEWAKNIRNR